MKLQAAKSFRRQLLCCSLLSFWALGFLGCDQSEPRLVENTANSSKKAATSKSDTADENTAFRPQVPLETDRTTSLPLAAGGNDLTSKPEGEVSAGVVEPTPDGDMNLDGKVGTQGPAIGNSSDIDQANNSAVARDSTEILNRPFATIQPTDSDAPRDLLQHLTTIDAAIRDLVIAGSNDIVEKQAFIDFGMRLGNMKLEAGQRLSNNPQATAEQRKTGVMATVTALSHMSGLGDVESAQQLETLANSLANSDDPELAHQSRVVLLGFELQALQNGLKSDAGGLVDQVQALFERPEDRNFPEFMMGQQALHVLTQMGFEDDAQRIQKILVREYQDSSDPQLRTQTWSYVTRDSQALANYNQATRALGSTTFNPQDLIAAARGLFNEFPTAQTLEQLAGSIANIEYSGQVELSRQLADFVESKLQSLESTAASEAARQTLANHTARMSLIGQSPVLENLVDFEGQALDWQKYRGKVVLLDFWATWCVPCLKELPNLRALHQQLHTEGFEIVGINMDEQLDAARNFIRKQDFPWKSYHFQDAAGFESQFAVQNGLNMIPFLVLIDRQGKVQRLHVRGDELTIAVREMLGLDTSLIPDQEILAPQD